MHDKATETSGEPSPASRAPGSDEAAAAQAQQQAGDAGALKPRRKSAFRQRVAEVVEGLRPFPVDD